MVSKNAGMPSGSKPERARIPKPTRSASVSFARVKLTCCWIASDCAAATPAIAPSPPPAAAPSRIAASIAAVETRLERLCAAMLRAM